MISTATKYTRSDPEVKPAAIPWQLDGCTFYHAQAGTRVCYDWTPVIPEPDRYNIALPLGRNNLVDIETDSPEAADWLDENARHLLPETFSYIKSRGPHRLYWIPEGLNLSKTEPFPGVEFRAGRHYSLVPPSVVDDIPYTIIQDAEIAELPGAALKLFTAPPTSAGRVSVVVPDLPHGDGWEEVIPDGERHNRLIRIERAFNWSRDWCRNVDAAQMVHADALYNVPCETPLEPADIEAMKRTAQRREYRSLECKLNPTEFVGKHYPDLTTNEHLFMVDLISVGLVYLDGQSLEVERAISLVMKNTGMKRRTAERVRKSLQDKGHIEKMKPSDQTVRTRKPSRPSKYPTNRYLIPIPAAKNDSAYWHNARQDNSYSSSYNTTITSVRHFSSEPALESQKQEVEESALRRTSVAFDYWRNIFTRAMLFEAFPNEPMSKLKANPAEYLSKMDIPQTGRSRI